MSNALTEVRLLNVPLENDYLHTFKFKNQILQAQYFLNKEVHSAENCSYQRKDKIIRFPKQYDELLNCNYVMYKNSGYSEKWFYAFISKIEFVHDEMSLIHIETDVMQTWMFEYTLKPSFVEREHVKDDTIGLHTLPEQLELGEYVINHKNNNASLQVHSYIMACTVDLNAGDDEFKTEVAGDIYNGIYSGVKYYQMNKLELNKAIKALAKAGKSDAIISVFVAPSLFTSGSYPESNPNGYMEVDASDSEVRKSWVNTFGLEDAENYKPTDLDGYEPVNNKLFTYPYCYMLMSNNSGGAAVYKYERFNHEADETLCPFYIYGCITPGFSIRIVPRDYNGAGINNEEGLTLGKYPICSWPTDVYTNWLTQNSVNIGISVASSVAGTAATIGTTIAGLLALSNPLTGAAAVGAGIGIAGSAAAGVAGVASTLAEVRQHSLQPPQAQGNINSGDVTFASGNLTFTAYQMTLKAEFAKVIDNYFSMYGYKINRFKTPHINHRKNFWFTKCIDVNIDGAIPSDDMAKIKACYNRGITFWTDPENIQNYTEEYVKDNTIV